MPAGAASPEYQQASEGGGPAASGDVTGPVADHLEQSKCHRGVGCRLRHPGGPAVTGKAVRGLEAAFTPFFLLRHRHITFLFFPAVNHI